MGAALAVGAAFNGHDLTAPGGLEVRAGDAAADVLVGPRVGIDYAAPADRDAPLRFACAGTRWVSVRRALNPPAGQIPHAPTRYTAS